ncbi:MAG: TolC family protein [Bacteroidota bacterium]
MKRCVLFLLRVSPLLVAAVVAGCTSVPRGAGFGAVQQTVAERADAEVRWYQNAALDGEATAAVAALLGDTLQVDEAVQVALLNNRRLQATYERLSIAQADLVQAGLLRNPVFGAGALWSLAEAEPPDLAFSVAFDFLGLLTRPLRRAVAAAAFEAEQAHVTDAVLRIVVGVQAAHTEAVAAQQAVELLTAVTQATALSAQTMRRLFDAGNVTRLELLEERALHEQTRLDLDAATAEGVLARERLTRLLGLTGPAATAYRLPQRLPPVPRDSLASQARALSDLEAEAVAQSLALDAQRHALDAAAQRLGLADATALVGDLEAGAELEREEGRWELGPEVHLPLPLFDQGQARRAAADAEVRRLRADYYAQAAEVRSVARAARERLLVAQRRALHLQEVVLPLRLDITEQTQRQYNAMQVGTFRLLLAKQQEIDAARQTVAALAAYWQARAAVDALRAGHLPDVPAALSPASTAVRAMAVDDH